MKIGVIGTGSMGSAVARALAKAGHDAMLGSRDRERGRREAAEMGAGVCGGSIAEAAQFGDVVVLAVPFSAVEETIEEAGGLDGKLIFDVTNALDHDDPLRVTVDTSTAEVVARLAPGARVVKALNYMHAGVVEDPSYDGCTPAAFYCGDDADAKATVEGLLNDLGLDPVDCGPLEAARNLESLCGLLVHLSVNQGHGSTNAFGYMRR